MLITPLPLNVRHARPIQVAVGPGAYRPLICDTNKVNTGAAETTRTDHHAAQLVGKAELLEKQAAGLAPQPLAERLRARAGILRAHAGQHHQTRMTAQENSRRPRWTNATASAPPWTASWRERLSTPTAR